MKCGLCNNKASGLVHLRLYTQKGINVCDECYKAIDSHRNKPYSRVMERLAIAEAGYKVNRKVPKLGR